MVAGLSGREVESIYESLRKRCEIFSKPKTAEANMFAGDWG